MHVTWWVAILCVGVIWAVTSDWRTSPRQARQRRELWKSGTGSHADAFAQQRRSYRREVWWQLPFGVALVAIGLIVGVSRDSSQFTILTGLWALNSGIVALVCVRTLGPQAQSVDD